MYLTQEQKQRVQRLIAQETGVYNSINDIHQRNGTVYLVGGCVRDILRNEDPADIDLEVHGISLPVLHEILSASGPVHEAGKSFGVLRVAQSAAEWSLPRTDSAGRKPVVTIDPEMSITKALERRDVTINAMAIDLTSYALIDPFGGYEDLKKMVLRSPNIHKFVEDPLRFYRVMQFIGRFSATVDPELAAVCKTMDIASVARERIEMEFDKLLLKSQRPSRGIRWLAAVGRLTEILPELAATIGVQQSPVWHKEGDVFEHSMQALDAAAQLVYADETEKKVIMYAALCHDLGKVTTTVHAPDGRITSHGHEIAGMPLARTMLRRITENSDLLSHVVTLVRFHMAPGLLAQQESSAAAYKRLASNAQPITLRQLSLLAYADRRGRNGEGHEPLVTPCSAIDAFVEKAQRIGVYENAEKPVIQGRDLIAHYGQGPHIGVLVRLAYRVQINKGIIDKERLLAIIAQEAKKL